MTLLTRYEPLSRLGTLNDWTDEEFSSFFPSYVEREAKHWHPPVDVLENENAFIIKVELPEVDEKKVDMKIEKNVLTLTGEREMEKEETGSNYRRMERYYGSFERSFRLPDSVDTDKVTAKMGQGVLNIVLPKKEETKPKSIKVEVK